MSSIHEQSKFILGNLQFAQEVIDNFPDPRVNLSYFRATLTADHVEKHPETCGTLFCGLGLMATIPKFRALGLKFAPRHTPSLYGHIDQIQGLTFNDSGLGAIMHQNVLDHIFGDDCFDTLFAARNWGIADTEILNRTSTVWRKTSDKELIMKRFDYQIARYRRRIDAVHPRHLVQVVVDLPIAY